MTPTNRAVVVVATDYLLYTVQKLHDVLVSVKKTMKNMKHGKSAFTLQVNNSRTDWVVGVGPRLSVHRT